MSDSEVVSKKNSFISFIEKIKEKIKEKIEKIKKIIEVRNIEYDKAINQHIEEISKLQLFIKENEEKVRTGGKVRTGKVRTGKVRTVKVRTGKVRTGKVRTGKINK